MSIKKGLFFFLTFCCIITSISGIIDHYCILENWKKKRNNKGFLFLYLNIRSVKQNFESFSNTLHEIDITFEVTCFTETWY